MEVLRNSSSGGDRFGCAPLCPSLHMRSYVSNVRLCVCGSGRVPRFLNVNFSRVVFLARSAANLREATPWLVPQRVLSPQWEGTDARHAAQQRQTRTKHFSRGNMLTVSVRPNLCELIVLKLLKRRPPGGVIDLNSPPKVRDQSSKVIYCHISPISVLKSCDNCSLFCL